MIRSSTVAKDALRRQLRSRLSRLDPARRTEDSARLCERVLGLPAWVQAGVVMLYAPLRDEPDVSPLWTHAVLSGKTLCLPRFNADVGGYEPCQIEDPLHDLTPGRFGILEPVPLCPLLPFNRLDLTLVPGVGFSPDGRRLGRGRGYYDRLLAGATGLKCGVGFDLQLVETIPTESHDMRLDCVLTPTRQCWVNPGMGVT